MFSPLQMLYIGVFLLIYTRFTEADKNYRLLEHIKPINYKLNLNIDPNDQNFYGQVEIILKIDHGVHGYVLLNAHNDCITIKHVTKNNEKCSFTDINPETQIFRIQCPTLFRSGDSLFIIYEGKYSTTEMNGLYKTWYDNGTLLVTTLFQPEFARKAFPCFDEPYLKATFDIIIQSPSKYRVLANTKLESSSTIRNITTHKFQRTPVMSSYLVAFVVSEFEAAVNENSSFNVFARPSASHNMVVAVKYGQQLYEALSRWIGIDYEDLGNPQRYLVAVPELSAGAMENWGLITFTELDLLDDGNRTRSDINQNIIHVMAHEIAHQWFGNYVTLDWWSNLWLNEGFATYFSYIITDMLENGTLNMEVEKQLVAGEMQMLLEQDTTLSSSAISEPESALNTPLEASNKFDEFTYIKGCSIVRMMKFILGEDLFKEGIHNYLNENKYGNVDPETLLSSLQLTARNEVTHFQQKMHNWIYHSGYPLVTVKQTNRSAVTVSQTRFLSNKKKKSKDHWYVPLSYTSQKEKDFSGKIRGWLEPAETYTIKHTKEDWLLLNIQRGGFYRVNYDDTLWSNIIDALHNDVERESIDSLDRAQLVDDIFHIARIGKVSYSKAFELANYLRKEPSFYPWMSANREFIYQMDMVDEKTSKLLTRFILEIIMEAFPENTEYVTHVDKLKQAAITGMKCKLEEEGCLALAKKQFDDFRDKNILPELSIQDAVFCYGLKKSDQLQDDYTFLLNVLKSTQSSALTNSILIALGCMEDEKLLKSYLDLTLDPKIFIRKQDFQVVFNAVYFNNKVGVSAALDFLEKNLKEMDVAYDGGNQLYGLLIDFATKLSTPEEVEKMKKILETYKDNENVQLAKSSVLDTIETNHQWKIDYGNQLKDVLLKHVHSAQPNHLSGHTIYICFFLLFINIIMTL
ncbi:aminopeptidase N-like [Diabrotica undecimpunctata]|uniref:aminopeptidase N-like n=1 Tax=Diabrotica undecimpunctata TaxID=50387 RepID=UPI003B63FB6D